MQPLKPGSRIGSFNIKAALGVSNHGVIYLARDTVHIREVAIQEYFPRTLVERSPDGVRALALESKDEIFEDGLTRFLQDARILAQIHDPYVARVIEYTETNGTAYLVMEYEAGQTLGNYLAKQPKLNDEDLHKVLVPMLKGLRIVHSEGLLHLDITPSNIFLRQNGPPVLIGFGSAGRTVEHENVSLDSRITPGYSPIELYHEGGNLGPWTDLYALGATIYRAISGVAPVDATKRVTAIAQGEEDPMVPAMEIGRGDYGTHVLGNIDWMLQPVISDRPESAGAVLGLLTTEHQSPQRSTAAYPQQKGLDPTSSQRDAASYRLPYRSLRQPKGNARAVAGLKKIRRPNGWVVAGGILSAIIALALWQTRSELNQPPTADSGDRAAETTPDTASRRPQDPKSATTPAIDEAVQFGRDDDDLRAAAFRELEQEQKQIEALLTSAREHIESERLVFPPEDNALSDFRAILNLDPDNVDAKEGIDRIVTRLVEDARASFDREQLREAETQLDEIEYIQSGRADVAVLRQEIRAYRNRLEEDERAAELRREQEVSERRRRIADLLARAESAERDERLTAPEDDNAYYYYRKIQELDEANAQALAGLKRVRRLLLDRVGHAVINDDFERGEALLAAATAIEADAETVELLRTQLQARRKALEQEKQRLQQEAELRKRQTLEQTQARRRQQQRLKSGIDAYYRGEYDEAFRLLNPLAEGDDPRAQFRVGVMYNLGRGVEQDAEIAQRLIRKALPTIQDAATSGEAWAQADLGYLYEDGLVVAKNDAEAVRWYRLAAEQGYAGAQTNLGVMYANGTGIEQDLDEAVRWLRLAAAQGDQIAQENLVTLGVK